LKEELKEQLREFTDTDSIIIPWSSTRYRKFKSFVAGQVKLMSLTNVSEYIYYLMNDESLPDSICECNQKKKFRTINAKYPRYCSLACLQDYTIQNFNEDDLIIVALSGVNRQSETFFPFRDLIESKVGEFSEPREYLFYLRNDRSLPNSICACGEKKRFYSDKTPYNEFCSKKCAAELVEMSFDENELKRLVMNGMSRNNPILNKYRDLIYRECSNFESIDEYMFFLRNDMNLVNSICECGAKKKFQNAAKPYCDYCVHCSSALAMSSEVRSRIAAKVSEYNQSLSEEDFARRTEVHRKTIENESIEYKETKKTAKRETMIKVHSNATPEQVRQRKANIKLAFDNLTPEQKQAIKDKIRKTNENNGNWITEDQVENFKDYSRLVWRYTNANDLSVLENIENRGMAPDEYHLDHRYSIFQGFRDDVPAKIIGSIDNLEMLVSGQNLSKNKKCSITLELLNVQFGN